MHDLHSQLLFDFFNIGLTADGNAPETVWLQTEGDRLSVLHTAIVGVPLHTGQKMPARTNHTNAKINDRIWLIYLSNFDAPSPLLFRTLSEL